MNYAANHAEVIRDVYASDLTSQLQKKLKTPILEIKKENGYWMVKLSYGWEYASKLLKGCYPEQRVHYLEIKK